MIEVYKSGCKKPIEANREDKLTKEQVDMNVVDL